jgi:ferric-dicitrate binding protein FerR (iron transport regulator)
VARDVGTAFDVRAYPEDAGVRIVVAEGAVAVTAAPAPRNREATGAWAISRNADDVAAADPPRAAEARVGDVATAANGRVGVKHGVDVASLTAWMQGRLVFDDTPLPEVVRELGRAYGIDITVADPTLAADHVTGRFGGSEPMSEVLDDIARSVGAHVQWHNRTVMLVPGRPTSTGPSRGTQPPINAVADNNGR